VCNRTLWFNAKVCTQADMKIVVIEYDVLL
jgi:hypothetical protein